jgi:hypothetical protein
MEEREALKEGKSCEVCGSTSNLVIDHCHVNGHMRGILCNKCNVALGMANDSVDRLLELIEYIQAYRA